MGNSLIGVILAGGQGSRFWPLSRQANPKQFLALAKSEQTLLQATVKRLQYALSDSVVKVVTGEEYEKKVREQIPEADIIIEPMPKNTAACIGLAAIHAFNADPQSIMACFPADHTVTPESEFSKVINQAVCKAREGDFLVTVGIKPTFANTGYGYIQKGADLGNGAFAVKRFFEKPNAQRAQEYYKSGSFFWNSGMFVWKTTSILSAFKEFLPALYDSLILIGEAIGTEGYNEVLVREFQLMESISIDIGVLEHARNAVVIEASTFEWSDIGSWDAWALQFKANGGTNICLSESVMIESERCVVKSHNKDKVIAVLGVSDLVIIDCEDALLVCHKKNSQDVKKIVEQLKAEKKAKFT